jgi:hypothetical protein
MVLAEKPFTYHFGEFYDIALSCDGKNITAIIDNKTILEGNDELLGCGGAGVFYENGTIVFRMLTVG